MAFDDMVLGAAANSKIIEVMLRSSTTGQAKTGVAYGSVAYSCIREGDDANHIDGTCADMTLDTWASAGWKETNIAGIYQFGVPQTALAAGKNAVTIKLVVSGAIDVCKRILILGSDLRTVFAAIQGATFNTSTDSLEAIRNRGDAAWVTGDDAGSGANTITITVTDGADPLEGARVRFTKGAESYVGTTNASGVKAFSLDNGTWSVAITLPCYQFTPTTLVVSASASRIYSMTAVTISSSDPGQVTGYLYCYDEEGDVHEGVSVTCRAVKSPTSASGSTDATGKAFSGAEHSEISDANGRVTFPNLVPGATYSIYGGDSSKSRTVLIALDATSPLALPSIVWTA
jgi:hypothetical protein